MPPVCESSKQIELSSTTELIPNNDDPLVAHYSSTCTQSKKENNNANNEEQDVFVTPDQLEVLSLAQLLTILQKFKGNSFISNLLLSFHTKVKTKSNPKETIRMN